MWVENGVWAAHGPRKVLNLHTGRPLHSIARAWELVSARIKWFLSENKYFSDTGML